MSVIALDAASQLRAAEARLGVRFPPAFRDAIQEQRAPKPGSRYVLLPLDEIDTTYRWGLPGHGVVVARSIAGGYVILPFQNDRTTPPRALDDAPFLWEPVDEDDDGEDSDLASIGNSIDDVLDPEKFVKSTLCPHCGSDNRHGACSVCGRRRGERPAPDPDRDAADAMVRALVQSGQLVTRSVRSTERIIDATTEVLHRVDDDEAAAAEIVQLWEDAAEVEEIFITPEELVSGFLPTRWRER